MALEDGTFASAGAVYPLVSPGVNSILQDADPAIYYATLFFVQMLKTHLGARWSAECIAANRADLAPNIVLSTSSYEPYSHLQELQLQLPMLAVYRMSAKSLEKSIQRTHIRSTWKVDWIMPPLTAAQMLRLSPFLKAVYEVMDIRASDQSDKSYASGASPWAQANVEEMGFEEYQLGNLKTASDITFPVMSSTFTCLERREYVVGAFSPLTLEKETISIVPTGKGGEGTTPVNPFVIVNTIP